MALNWNEIEDGRAQLNDVERVELSLSPLEFVVVNEIFIEYQERNPDDERVKIVIQHIEMNFVKKQGA